MNAIAIRSNEAPTLAEMEQSAAQVEAELAKAEAGQAHIEKQLEAKRAQLAELAASWRRDGLSVPANWSSLLSSSAPRSDAVKQSLARAEEARRTALQLRDDANRAWKSELAGREKAMASEERELARALANAAEELARMRAARTEAPKTSPAPTPSSPKEQRRHPRARFEAFVDLTSDDNFYTGFSSDISEGGIFVGTAKLLPVGSQVELSFSIGEGFPVTVGGTVQWIRDVLDDPRVMPGMGVRFDALPDETRRQIHQFMSARDPLFFD